MFLEPCLESGIARESTLRYGFRMLTNILESALV